MQCPGACWPGVIGGTIGIELGIGFLLILNVSKRVDSHEQADYHDERQDDCESLAHRV